MLQPTTPEQREAIYQDVLSLLTPGIISSTVRVGNVDLAFRSLGPGDLYLLQCRTNDDTTLRDWRAWFVAGSVWMVNGEVILGDPSAARVIHRTLTDLPNYAIRALFYQVFGLVRRVHDAADKIEAFCYEPTSRYMWKQIGTRFDQSGIPGAEKLGLNVIQRVWTAMNVAEDERAETLHAWECAKLVASTQAYKSIKRMSQSERSHQDFEQQRRQEVMDRAYWKHLGYSVDSQSFQEQYPLLRTKSADELMDEYKRWVEGEVDWHDQVVAEHKNRIKQGMMAEAERIRRLNEEYEQKVADLGLPSSSPGIVGYTPDQVQAILERARNTGMRGTHLLHEDDLKERNFRRFIAPKEVPSRLSVKDVFRSEADGPTLDEQIAGRKVRLDPGEGQ